MEKTIIEINGVKMEVDLRHAKRIETLRVGDPVKVLTKDYGGHKVHYGVVVGFEPFKELPTVIVAYMNVDYTKAECKFLYFNKQSKDVEIVASDDRDILPKSEILERFDRELAKKRQEMEEIQDRKRYFEQNFGEYYRAVAPGEVAEGA